MFKIAYQQATYISHQPSTSISNQQIVEIQNLYHSPELATEKKKLIEKFVKQLATVLSHDSSQATTSASTRQISQNASSIDEANTTALTDALFSKIIAQFPTSIVASQELARLFSDIMPQLKSGRVESSCSIKFSFDFQLERDLDRLFKTFVWNSATYSESIKHIKPPKDEKDSIANTFAVFKKNPGLFFATIAIAVKYLGFNPSASQEYINYITTQSRESLTQLWKANPGLISGALTTLIGLMTPKIYNDGFEHA